MFDLRKLFVLFLLPLLFTFSQSFQIKSLRVYGAGDEKSFPLSPIQIEFDLKTDKIPDLMIVFKFCDENWQPYDNLLLQNLEYDTDYQLWYETLPTNITGADYRFNRRYPNKNVKFPFSGKWMFFIVDKFKPEKVYAEGGFYNVFDQVPISVKSAKERLYRENEAPNTEGRTLRLETQFTIPDTLFPHLVDHIEIVKNREIDYPIVLNTKDFDNLRYYEYDGVNTFDFVVRDLYPGNNYRESDLRNDKKFIGPDVNAIIDRIETSRYFKFKKNDINGASVLLNYKNRWADYLNVKFTLRPDTEKDDRVFLVGAFNDWMLLPEYEMQNDDGLFTIQIELKRGLYDYQYVVLRDEYFDWNFLEGNFYETSNEYNIFVYYNSEDNGGYSQIIGHKRVEIANGKIKSGSSGSRSSRKTSHKAISRPRKR